MEKQKVIETLEQLNNWRRCKEDVNAFEMPNPTDTGIAIDEAIKLLKK
jgi:hypothetical protein